MKRFAKELYLGLCKYTGQFRKMRSQNASRPIGLCYHSVVSDDSPNDFRTNIAVSVKQFEKHLKIIRKDWNPVSLHDIFRACYENERLPDYSVFVTFDDGYRNNYTLAAPLLKEYNVPATVFVTSGLIGTEKLLWTMELRERVMDGAGNFVPGVLTDTDELPVPSDVCAREKFANWLVERCKSLPHSERINYLERLWECTRLNIDLSWKKELYEFMNWDEVRDIRNYGVSIGAHTVSHPILSTLEPDDLEKELSESKSVIESELDEECFSLAYPNGGKNDFNEQVMEEAKRLGFRIGFNLFERRNPEMFDNPMSIDRCCITREFSTLEFERKMFI